MILIKGLQRYQRSKLEVKKNLPDQPGPECIGFETGRVGNFLPTSNFDLWYFCSLFTYKSRQYLIWKIWLISVWRLKARAMKWLLIWFMFAQSTLISYHIEAFVKTEVGCTVTSTLYYIREGSCGVVIKTLVRQTMGCKFKSRWRKKHMKGKRWRKKYWEKWMI